jgi:hypothetical protein
MRTDTLRGRERDTTKNLIKEKSLIKARKYQLKAQVNREKAVAVKKITGAVDRANFLSAFTVYNSMGMPEKAKEHLQMYEASLATQEMKEASDEMEDTAKDVSDKMENPSEDMGDASAQDDATSDKAPSTISDASNDSNY